jgi:phosphohistidine phosphatase
MNIILMRHGEAVPFAQNDADRILTPKGKAEAANTGTQLKKASWIPQAVFCSTRIRAQQTAELVISALGSDLQSIVLEGITPDDDWAKAMAVIEQHAVDHSLFVFHQPILTQIVGHLTDGSAHFDVYPRAVPATAYLLKLDALLPGAAALVGAYQPQ